MLKNLISLGIKKVLKSAQSKSSHAFVNMFFAGDRILNFYWQQNLAKNIQDGILTKLKIHEI